MSKSQKKKSSQATTQTIFLMISVVSLENICPFLWLKCNQKSTLSECQFQKTDWKEKKNKWNLKNKKLVQWKCSPWISPTYSGKSCPGYLYFLLKTESHNHYFQNFLITEFFRIDWIKQTYRRKPSSKCLFWYRIFPNQLKTLLEN